MIRCFLPTGNINKIDLCMASIEVHLFIIILYLGYFYAISNVFCAKKLAIGQQIIFNSSIITQKRNLVIVTPSIRFGQVMNKFYNTRLPNMKVLKIMKV